MKMFRTNSPERQQAINGLAAVGFIALMVAGMWLAVYSARFVPDAVNRLGAAAVYLGSVFKPSSPGLSVVPSGASTTIPFDTASTSTDTTSTKTTPSKSVSTTAGAKTDTVTRATPVLSGLPDLATTITGVGFLAFASTDSFVASSSIPAGSRPAVKFTIKNIGTNVSGSWRFSASIPTQNSFVFQSEPQLSLNPGDSIDYTLGFDPINQSTIETISVTANFDGAVAESSISNDSISVSLTVGS